MQLSVIFATLSAVTLLAAAVCCGVGKCNAFCCDCKGGCRKASSAVGKLARGMSEVEVPGMSDEPGTDADVFRSANVDGTGNLTQHQYTRYMGAADDDETYVNWFHK